jgi:hypothetical protein
MFAWVLLVIADPHLEFPDYPPADFFPPFQGSFRSLASLLQPQMSTATDMPLYPISILCLRSLI